MAPKMQGSRNFSELLECEVPETLPLLPLMSTLVFPFEVRSVDVRTTKSRALVTTHVAENDQIALFLLKDPMRAPTRAEDLFEHGILARLLQRMNMPNNTVQVVLQGMQRVSLVELLATEPFYKARLVCVEETPASGVDIDAQIAQALDLFKTLIESGDRYPEELLNVLRVNMGDAGRFADMLTGFLHCSPSRKQPVLAALDFRERLTEVIRLLKDEIERIGVESDVKKRTDVELTQRQREYYLREQMQVIRRELGEAEGADIEADRYRRLLEETRLPEGVAEEVRRETDRLATLSAASPEFEVSRNRLRWIFDIPWSIYTETGIDLAKARDILDADHFGLPKIKERILELLAVAKLKKDSRGPIICFLGPPGVGKTSLGQSIARATGREFVRLSVGGLRDEAEIRGHRRTYIGSLPGKIAQSLKRARSMNPLIMIDELDKMGSDARGDPSSALLEVLDPAQNHAFMDYYLDVPLDLSRVLFIGTANVLDGIPGPLRDRMEIITLAGYAEEEKLPIAKAHLMPRQVLENGLLPGQIEISDAAIRALIAGYTREAGVRNLERLIGSLCRKAAFQIAGGGTVPLLFDVADLERLLGPAPFEAEMAGRHPEIGLSTGLAWTPTGGDLLFIEATGMPGHGEIVVTGQLGGVMKESVETALSFVRSRAGELGIDERVFNDRRFHIHFPEGAIPKDGPSAGVAIALAFASLLTGREVRHDFAVTGEITLRGRVLPVGGIKEKMLAAARGGIRRVLLPSGNRKNLADLPAEVKQKLQIDFIDNAMDAVRDGLLEPAAETARTA
ncbi:MAG TPA: endopeptidase La [Patescibacteria group bacterium]|nr:endopeptidase La [Patescibacteria group bacterium]